MTNDTIGAEDLRDLMERGGSATILDIRHLEDFEEWTIPGSIHLDAYDALWRMIPRPWRVWNRQNSCR